MNQCVIGICLSNAKKSFSKLVNRRLESYPGDALLVAFRIENVSFEDLHVIGTLLNKKDGAISLQQGTFPFPDAIYMQCPVERERLNRMKQVIGPKIFNDFMFDKWECHQLLSQSEILSGHLPEARKMVHAEDLESFLCNYGNAFLKPIDVYSHSSLGIIHVRLLKERGYEAIHRQSGRVEKFQFDSFQECGKWISNQIANKPYMLQQSIQTVKRGEWATDIRLNMNKNGHGEWEVSGAFFRVASNDSHMIPGQVMAYLISDWRKLFPHNTRMKDVPERIAELGFHIAACFDRSGYHMAELGMDLGLDENGRLWIFELNPLPYPLALLPDQKKRVLAKPLEYAHFLASQIY